jgi:hypothetical protein
MNTSWRAPGSSCPDIERRRIVVPAVVNPRNYHRTADGSTVLIALQLIASRGKEVARIELRIPEEFERFTVQAVGARFRDDIYYAAGILPIFRAVIAGLGTQVIAAVELIAGLKLTRSIRRNGRHVTSTIQLVYA